MFFNSKSIRTALLVALAFCFIGSSVYAAPKQIKIGLSMDTLKEERWQKDRDLFVKKAKELGAEVAVQAANGNDALQISQAENLLTQGIDILVVVPHNGVAAAAIVKAAHKAGKKVIAYDRMIDNSDVDMYLSFDNVDIGRMQARYALQHAPKGNYVVISGAPTDHNAVLYRQGQMEILKPAADRGDIKIVADPWAREWLASEALKHTENTLSRYKDNIQAIIATNDGIAGGAIAALKQQKLDGKVIVTGMDGDLAACQRVAEGSQSFTVYKPIKLLAEKAAEVAVKMAKGETIASTGATINNGKKDVPSIFMSSVLVDKTNLDSTVIKDKYHAKADVYKNVKAQ